MRQVRDDGHCCRHQAEHDPQPWPREKLHRACHIQGLEAAKLREQYNNREPVDKPQHHGVRHDTDKLAEPEQPDDDLDEAAEHNRREQVPDAVVRDKRNNDDSHRPGRARDHARPAPRDGGDQADDERCIEPHERGHAREEGKRDRLGHKRESHGQSRKNLGPWRAAQGGAQIKEVRAKGDEAGDVVCVLGHVFPGAGWRPVRIRPSGEQAGLALDGLCICSVNASPKREERAGP